MKISLIFIFFKFKSDFKFHLDSCAFPSSAIITSDETKFKKIEDTKKNTIRKEKLKIWKAENIFSKKRRSKSFIKTLNSLNSFCLPTSSPTSHSLLPYGNNKFDTSSEH